MVRSFDACIQLKNLHLLVSDKEGKTMPGDLKGRTRDRRVRTLGWLMVFGGLLIMSGGLFLEQSSPPTISSLGLILSLGGIAVLTREVEQDKTREKPGVKGGKRS